MTAYTSLPAAVRAAIKHGTALSDVQAIAWATTYHCSTEELKSAWEDALTELSRQPSNPYEVPDGK
jgi:hypothetical protein